MQELGAKKRDSYFGIDNSERIQKFLHKLNKTLRKIIYDEKGAAEEEAKEGSGGKKDDRSL